MELDQALEWSRNRTDAVLITIRRDGRPQSSDISYALDSGIFIISVTADRAKTFNMRRDPRVVLHLTDRSAWSYLSYSGTVELTPVTREPGDATSDELVDYYTAVTGQDHPDWDDYRRAMVDEERLLVRFSPSTVVGQLR